MRLLHFIFSSLGLLLILQSTASNNDHEILQKLESILTNVTTCRLLSQDSSSGKLTTIEVSAKNGKTLVLDGINLSEGFSVVDNNSSQDGSKAILETVIIKNFNIDYNLIESISNILTYYRKTLSVLTIDSCSFKLPLQLSDLPLKVKKLKIINSDLDKDFLNNFEIIDELSLYHSNLAIIDNPDTVYLNIKKLEVYNSDLSQSFLQFLNHHRTLEELIVKNCKLSFDSVQNVSFGIKRLEISYCSLSICFNQFLHHLELLEEFIFDNCSLPSPNFGRIFSTNIKKLQIINCISTENMLNAILFNSKNVLEELTIDHFYFTSQFIIHNNFKLKNLKIVKITHCALNEEILKKTLSLFPSSLQTLELSHLCINRLIDGYMYYGRYLILDFVYLNVERFAHLKNLTVKENNITEFRFENFEELEEFECDEIFKSYVSLNKFYEQIESITSKYSNITTIKIKSSHDLSTLFGFTKLNLSYLLNAFYISVDLVSTESDNIFSEISESMKSVKEKCSKLCEFLELVYGHSDNLNELQSKSSELSNGISILRNLIPKECPRLSDKLKKLKSIKRIKTGEYFFKDHLNYFVEENITVDSNAPIVIFRNDLPNIPSILSRYTNVWFYLKSFTSDDIGLIPLENGKIFEHLESVTFNGIGHTSNITFMNCILNRFLSIRTITVDLSIENITKEQIAYSFNDVDTYDEIQNVHFTNFSDNASATCEFIIQTLRRVPNLKSLSFEYMKKDVIDILFNRLQKENWVFPNLQKIDIRVYNGSINLLLWFIQTFPVEELNINAYNLSCSPNEVLDNFSSKTLRKLCITSNNTPDNAFLKKGFDNMVNLKELHFKFDLDLITLFENNSTIETVILRHDPFHSERFQLVFSILKTFKSLKSIYVEFDNDSYSFVIAAFKKHFKGRDVKLIFYSEEGYFQ